MIEAMPIWVDVFGRKVLVLKFQTPSDGLLPYYISMLVQQIALIILELRVNSLTSPEARIYSNDIFTVSFGND